MARITYDGKAGIVVATLGYWRQLNEGTINSILPDAQNRVPSLRSCYRSSGALPC